MAQKKKQSLTSKVFYIATQMVLSAILFFAAAMLTDKGHTYVAEREANEQIRNEFGITFSPITPTPSKESVGNASSSTDGIIAENTQRPVPLYPLATPPRYSYPQGITVEQLKSLKKRNNDFAFWLYIGDTTINYNVMQAADNDYYLHRNIDGKYAESGSLFLDFRNDPKTLSGHTIVYGHNMNDGSMFGNLLKFYMGGTDEHLKKHPYMYTYSEDGVGIWKIFSVYETTADEYYIETNFDSQELYYNFIKDLQNKSVFKTDVLLKATDDVMTLSTCYKFHHVNGRLVVSAVRVGTSILN